MEEAYASTNYNLGISRSQGHGSQNITVLTLAIETPYIIKSIVNKMKRMCLYDQTLSSDTQVTTLSQSPLNYWSEHYSMIQQYLTLKHSLHS